MTDRVRQQFTDYLLGNLEGSEMEDIRARLESDPAYRRAATDLGRIVALKQDLPPPPGLAKRTCERVFDPD